VEECADDVRPIISFICVWLTDISGLGTGLSTTALIRHGLNTTVVEIDPAVYEAARTWFGLPDPGNGNVFLEDARRFVQRRAQQVSAGTEACLYDIVVHDCFSGGGVPEHIFTTEFWASLRQIMDTESVLVVVSQITPLFSMRH
jgi:spermidine synthase